MVQVVENRADLGGVLLESAPDPSRPGHRRLTVRVEEVIPHPDYPNLLAGLEGQTIDIVSPEAGAPPPGPVRLAVKKAGPATFVALPRD
jgi:hypothetical protein